jgi:citrate lyase subunit beta/citryl-CoA lyase
MHFPKRIGAERTSFTATPQGVARPQAAGHESAMPSTSHRPRRSVLYVPASNDRALAKIAALGCDAVILDLEDAVAPAEKVAAREKLSAFMKQRPAGGPEIIIRINPVASEWGADDLLLAGTLQPDGILLPKVDTPRDILEAGDVLDDNFAEDSTKLWAMIETPKAILNLGAIAELGRDPASRLAGFVAGTNDLAKETGISVARDRRYLVPLLVQMVVAARAGGLVVLDGVVNAFKDAERFSRECEEAAGMGFDGKTLIHPDQIEPANKAFAPDAEAIAEARAVVAAFALAENAGKGAIAIGGRMVERLHLTQAEALLAKTTMIGGSKI